MTDSSLAKRAAAQAAADLVQDGMKIGLGSGSTFLLVIDRLAERMRSQGLAVSGVATSKATAEAAAAAGIAVIDLDTVDRLDLAIDGADEVDPQKNLIKGGGGAHVRERIVAAAAKEMVVVVDEAKLVDVLGKVFLLPVEVLQFGWKRTERLIAATGGKPVRREREGVPFVSDNGNFVLDCKYDGIEDPAWLAQHLDSLVGVVDHGLFVGMAGRILVGNAAGKVRVIP
ncbi:MAG TPA: ribose-5-phosphate isomerase RpiA [Planctomycetota bacterium]|nr:ribose-5-phosphate isomerase RpiA [Planctomycetota bacterium]